MEAAAIINKHIPLDEKINVDKLSPADIEGSIVGWWQFWEEEKGWTSIKIRRSHPHVAEYLDKLCEECAEEARQLEDQPPAEITEPSPSESQKEPNAAKQEAEAPKAVVQITDRIALEALAQIAGWEPKDPDISSYTDDQCGEDLRENVGLLDPEDQPTVEAMENGKAIWKYFQNIMSNHQEGKQPRKESKSAPKISSASRSSKGLDKCKDRSLGYDEDEPACRKCIDRDECISRTVNRLAGIAVDISRNLLNSESDVKEISNQYGIAQKELRSPDSLIGFSLDTLRQYIFDMANVCIRWFDDEGKGKVAVQALALPKLSPWTIYYLNRMVPEWGERFKEHALVCVGPLQGHCRNCKWLEGCRDKWLNWAVRVPLYITRVAMRELSPPAFTILINIASHVNWVPAHPHFGMCWLTYEQIRNETNIQQPHRQIKELKEKGFIQQSQIVRNNDGGFRTTNCFTVNWFGQLRDLGVENYAKKGKQKRKGV